MTLLRCLALVFIFYTVATFAAPLEAPDEAELANKLEERLAALNPEERFDWKGFGKHIIKHVATHFNARDLNEEEESPEELNDLTPEERSFWSNLAHHVGHAALTYALGGK